MHSQIRPGAPALVFDRVTVRHGETVALADVSVSICSGERVALVGQSGAGKSTFISLANTTLTATEGTVELFGHDPVLLDKGERLALRRRIGTVPQGLHMPGSLRVIHNVNAGHLGRWSTLRSLVSLARPQQVEQAREALDSFGIADMLWRRTDDLSGGERQRVALARLVVQQATLVLADEPTASLDPARASDVLEILASMATDRGAVEQPVVVVSIHDFDMARRHFDRLIGLRAGRVMFDLPASDVADKHGTDLYRLCATP